VHEDAAYTRLRQAGGQERRAGAGRGFALWALIGR
jgi:hypothetical protein